MRKGKQRRTEQLADYVRQLRCWGKRTLTPKDPSQWYDCFAKHVATWKEGEDKMGIQNKVQSIFI